MTPRARLAVLAASAGAMVALSWLPFGLTPLFPLAPLLAMRGLRLARGPRDAVLFGLVYGGTCYAVACHFFVALLRFSPLAIVLYLLAVIYILPYTVFEAWGAFTLERTCGLPRSIALALLDPLMEKVRTLGDLSFPADLVAHAFGRDPAWLAGSGWAGPFGTCLLVWGVGAVLDLAVERRAQPRKAAAIALAGVALWLAPPAASALAPPSAAQGSPRLRVAIVQPAESVRDKLDPERWRDNWSKLERLTLEAAPGADLVVWPETARPGRVTWVPSEPFRDARMEALANRARVPILYGCEIGRARGDGTLDLFNGAALARPDGEGADWYGKQRLLPLVEGVPFARWIGWDPARRGPEPRRSFLTLLGNFTPGPRPTIFEVGPARIGVMICYEGSYPALARRYREEGANTLVVLTNDAWWGHTAFAYWHADMVSSRARELGLPVLRAANSGVSSLTTSDGRMVASTRLDDVTVLRTTLTPGPAAPTFYARHGDLVIGLDLLFLAGVIARGLAIRTRRHAKTPGSPAPTATGPAGVEGTGAPDFEGQST